MTVREAQQQKVVAALARHLLATGLGQTSLRQLAAAAGVSDRMLLYYFPDKNAILMAVLGKIAGELTAQLATAIPEGDLLGPNEFLVTIAKLTTRDEMRPGLRLWVELVAAAAKKEEPYAAIARQIMAGFQNWVVSRLDVPDGMDPSSVATAIIALIDGLALVEICVGAENVAAAVHALAQMRLSSL